MGPQSFLHFLERAMQALLSVWNLIWTLPFSREFTGHFLV